MEFDHETKCPAEDDESNYAKSREMEATPSSFIKLNFDGASKGNPGPAGGEGVFRNSQGEILHIYTINLGHSTNNSAELNAMVKGLNIAIYKGFEKLILEGDSSLVITIYHKLLNDTPPCKVSQSWRL